jgi:hypothetical protein
VIRHHLARALDGAGRGKAVFGAFDGATGAIGVLVGLVAAGAPGRTVLAAAVGLAVAAAAGMGAGDWLSGTPARPSAVLAAATGVGTILPALPVVLWPGPVGLIGTAVVMVALGIGIAEARDGTWRSYGETFAVLIGAAALSLGAALSLLG